MGRNSTHYSTDRKLLESDRNVRPFTLLDADEIARHLPLHARSPLIVVEATDSPFRVTEARWVGSDGTVVVRSAAQLARLIAAWDGKPPPVDRFGAARDEAEKAAKKRVAALRKQAADAAQAGIDAQLAAARSRLLGELARHLRLLGKGDLRTLFQQQVQREQPQEGRYHRALALLGGWPTWTKRQIDAAAEFAKSLGPGERQDRINLPSQLDAALNAPRWMARTK